MFNFSFFRRIASAKDCGPSCLRMIAKHYGKQYSIENLRIKCSINNNEANLQGISDAAEVIGFETMAVKISFQKLKDEAILPCIIHWKQNVFIVVHKISNKFVYVFNPTNKKRKYSIKEFLQKWIISSVEGEEKGIVLLLEPTPSFYTLKDDRKSIKTILKEKIISVRKVTKNKITLIITFLSIFVLSLLLGIKNTNIGFLNYSLLLLLNYLGFFTSFILKGVLKYKENNIISQICHYSKSFDCEKVSNEKLFKIFKFSDIGLVYFSTAISLILLSLLNNYFINLFTYISICTMPFVLILILIQFFKIKKICPFCMLVHFILIFDFVFLLKYYIYPSEWLKNIIPIYIFITLLTIFVFLIVDFLLIEYNKRIGLTKIIEFYEDTPSLIVGYLDTQPFNNYKILPNELVFGNKESENSVLLILTLSCKSCQIIINKISKILLENINFKIIIRFRVFEEIDTSTIITFYQMYKEKDQRTMEVILNWYDFLFAKKKDVWFELYKKKEEDFELKKTITNISMEVNNIYDVPLLYYNNKYIHYYLRDSFINFLKTIKI